MTTEDNLKNVQNFIYSKEVQDNLEKINNHLMDINVLEISGMGSQEIKHSNVLAWMFGDNQHQLGYQILEKFLAKISAVDNHNSEVTGITKLRQYAYFKHPKNIKIEREYTLLYGNDKKKEKCIIDLLLIDEDAKIVIAIENKVWSGEGDNQLLRYQHSIDNTYGKSFSKYFIYLTPQIELNISEYINNNNSNNNDSVHPERWLTADYQMIYDLVRKILEKPNQNILDEARLVLESYNDLLIKENIVTNQDLSNLCSNIWQKHREALDILIEQRPSNIDKIAEIIEKELDKKKGGKIDGFEYVASQNTKTIFRFTTDVIKKKYIKKNQQDFYYYLEITLNGLWLGLILNNVDGSFLEQLINKKIINGKTQKQICNVTIDKWEEIKFTPVNKDDELPNSEIFLKELNKVIEELIKFERDLDQVINENI